MGRHRPKGKRADDRTDLLEKSDMQNERLFSYYKAQNIVPPAEWDLFVDSLRQHLPTTFRVAGSRLTANTLNSQIAEIHVPTLSDVTFEDQKIPPPVQIPWYPDGLAWQFNVPKKVLRKSPEFKKFHSFLVFETEVGNISRQEAVSMLPPLFLDVEPHHRVMDMCAAPGSKTAQLLEALHSQDTFTSSSIPPGLLLANDSDSKRTHLLIHQSSRLPSPAFMVTNLDASNYPNIKIPVTKGGKVQINSQTGKPRVAPLLFDRILCDVPCSGDGTIRKNMGIWKSWQPNDGNGLHSLQVRILQRAMKLLKDDGRIVYSTCSLNPVENEAVIAEALLSSPAFELVDVSAKLPELKRRPGLTTWRPTTDKSCTRTFESYEEFMASDVDQNSKTKMSRGHWPPDAANGLNLSRCMRVYPHLQDSGGFFVAVLQKAGSTHRKREVDENAELPETKKPRVGSEPIVDGDDTAMFVGKAEVSKTDELEADGDDDAFKHQSAPTSEVDDGSFRENPYIYLTPSDSSVASCMDRLHINSTFPTANILVRNPNGDAARSLYLSNDIVKAIIQHNSFKRLRLTSAGTKIFARQETGKEGSPQFRVLGEGLPVVLPYIDAETILEGDVKALKVLVESYYPLTSSFEREFRDKLEAREVGSHVLHIGQEASTFANLNHDLVLPIWKSNVSVALMIDKKAKSALSLRLFGVDLSATKSVNQQAL